MNGDESYYSTGRNVTLVGLFSNVALFIIKLLVGIFGNSQALLADAVHSVSDFATDLVVLFGLKMAAKPQDEDHPYGHERIETLSTFIIGAILVYAALRIGLHAGQTIYSHETSSPKPIAIVAAAISLISKEILFRYTLKVGRRIRSESVIANAWHHRSDAFSSVATLVGVTSAVFIPSLRILDPYAALIVAFIIVKVGTEISWKAAKEIVDTAPHEEERRMIEDVIRGMDDVLLVHDLKTRYFGRYILADVHIEVAPDITVEEGHNIATKVKEEVLAAVPIMMNLLVHVEPAGDYESRHRP